MHHVRSEHDAHCTLTSLSSPVRDVQVVGAEDLAHRCSKDPNFAAIFDDLCSCFADCPAVRNLCALFLSTDSHHRKSVELALMRWFEIQEIQAELSAALACKANADTLIELLQQQQRLIHADFIPAECSSASDAPAAAPHIDRATRRLSNEHTDLRAASARVVTLQWELGRCNSERQG